MFSFYRCAQTCWWPINQVDLINSTWLVLSPLTHMEAVKVITWLYKVSSATFKVNTLSVSGVWYVYTLHTRLPVPLPTGGCASAACRMVHTISSISALSCLSDNTTGKNRRRLSRGVTKTQETKEKPNDSKGRKQRKGLRERRVSGNKILLHHLVSLVLSGCILVDSASPKGNKISVKYCVPYSLLPARAPPAAVQSYTPSLSATLESFPTESRQGKLHARGATHKITLKETSICRHHSGTTLCLWVPNI